MFTLTFIKAFFSHWLGISFLVIILALGGYAAVERSSLKTAETTITTQATKIGSLQAEAAQFQQAASDCSAGTAAVQTADVAASASAAIAVSEADIKAKVFTNNAKKIRAQKPASSDDYTASKLLMDQLIDSRQAQLKGATQ